MADNFDASNGTVTYSFASDEVAGKQYARVKQSVGPDGVAQDQWTPFSRRSTADTNLAVIKASSCALGSIQVFNTNAAPRYLKLYNLAVAPTLASDVPVKRILIPGNANGAGAVMEFGVGVLFSTGLAMALTTGVADNDTGGVALNEIIVNIDYA